jgi:uncharacterized protein YkwD
MPPIAERLQALPRRLVLMGAGTSLVAGLLSGCSTFGVLAPEDDGIANDDTDGALPLVNAIRATAGHPPLGRDASATIAAREQALRMARLGRMSHEVGPDKSFLARMKRLEVGLPAAENIATGQDDVAAAVAAWRSSPKHLANMLGAYSGLGVAVARNTSSDNRPYWSMVLSNAPRGFLIRGTG